MKNALSLSLLVLSLPLAAQTPYLVKDINTTFASHTASSAPTSFSRFGNRIYFTATTKKEGTELWSSDGTAAGTRIVSDLVPGSGSANPGPLIDVNGTALFLARDADHGIEWWTTDGTAAGTHLFMDLNPGPGSSQPFAGIFYNNRLLFTADDGVNGRELWSTDGTVAGTRMIKDIAPGSASSLPGTFRLFNGQVYFAVSGALWKTDGTEANTVKVASVSMRNCVVIGSLLFFEGFTAATGIEPWVSDGTEAGTRMLTELIAGPKGGFDSPYSFQSMIALGNRAIFVANDVVHGRELWSSDGTVAGTRMIREFVPGPVGMWDTSYLFPTIFGNRVVFAGKDDQHGTELWSTDGTEQGTALLLDVVPGKDSSNPNGMTLSGDKLFFTGSDPDVPNQPMLYVTDGTAAGTHVINKADGGRARFDIYSSSFWPIDGRIYFAATDSLHGSEPWVTDGTAAGTAMIANLESDEAPSAYPYDLTPAGNLLYFVATDGAQNYNVSLGLWRTDGTAAGTFKLMAMDDAWEPVRIGSLVIVQQRYNYMLPQWITDGTVAGTQPIAGFMSRFGPPTSHYDAFFPFGDTLFAVFDSLLWKTTAAMGAPAIQLGKLAPRAPFDFVDFGGRQIFWAQSKGLYDFGLWITDGTPAGTYAIVPYLGDTSSQRPSDLAVAAGTIFFAKTLRDERTKLWKSDGTFDGTTAVKEIPAGVAQLKGAGRKVFIADGNKSLWASDGTEAGTIELMKVDFTFSYQPNDLRPLGDRMLFVTMSAPNEYELWSSDGTKEGTKLLRALGPSLGNLAIVDGLAYFAASDADHGTEPWTTDGTPEGTRMLFDLNPGPASSSPGGFAKVGSLLYFAAYTEATGNELWALPLTQSQLSIGDTHVSEGDSGTNAAHFTVTLDPPAKQSVTVEFATGDGTAHAGEDYDAASGTLTFAPGETTKTIDVRVRGDAAVENDETFAVTLRNPAGAIFARREAFAVIDDEEQLADMKVELTPTVTASEQDAVTVADLGPRSATDVKITFTGTPAALSSDCYPFTCGVAQLANGASTLAFQRMYGSGAMYKSAIVAARQLDPQPANNAVGWVTTAQNEMIMYGLYLNPGGSTTVSLGNFGVTTMGLQSSDPTVVAAPSTVTYASSNSRTTFTITALKPGTAKITAVHPQYGPQQNTLPVTVVAAGTTPRWPVGMTAQLDYPTGMRLDLSTRVKVTFQGTAPLSGAPPSGIVTVSRSGHELARKTLTGADPLGIDFYPDDWGQLTFDVNYLGDANFLPQAQALPVFIVKGTATLIGGLERSTTAAGSFTLKVRAQGSPVKPPTGTITVYRNGVLLATVPLAVGAGQSSATAVLSNLPVSPTVSVSYSGDGYYSGSTQDFRVIESHRRPVGH